MDIEPLPGCSNDEDGSELEPLPRPNCGGEATGFPGKGLSPFPGAR